MVREPHITLRVQGKARAWIQLSLDAAGRFCGKGRIPVLGRLLTVFGVGDTRGIPGINGSDAICNRIPRRNSSIRAAEGGKIFLIPMELK